MSATPKIPRTGPPRSRLPIYLGAATVAVLGYYLYNAGGDAKVARDDAKHDANYISAKTRNQFPGNGNEAKASAEETLASIGSKVDSTVREGKNRIAEGQKALNQTKDRAGSAIMDKIDQADLKLEEGAGKGKKSVGGWFWK